MSENIVNMFFFLDIAAFLAVVFMHVVKHSRALVRLYALQSLAVAATFLLLGWVNSDQGLMWVGVITLLVKAWIAPTFFRRALKRLVGGAVSANNYLNIPVTLFVITGLVMFAFSSVFAPLLDLYPQTFVSPALNIAMVLISVFLLINRRGVFAQMVGILSLENSIVLFATFFGIEHPLPLEIGTLFDIALWMVIASLFLGIVYRQFGTLSTAHMKHLTE